MFSLVHIAWCITRVNTANMPGYCKHWDNIGERLRKKHQAIYLCLTRILDSIWWAVLPTEQTSEQYLASFTALGASVPLVTPPDEPGILWRTKVGKGQFLLGVIHIRQRICWEGNPWSKQAIEEWYAGKIRTEWSFIVRMFLTSQSSTGQN